MPDQSTRRAWWVRTVVAGGPVTEDIFGAVRISDRLHWTEPEARAEGERFAAELGLDGDEIHWDPVDDDCAIGRFKGYAILVRSILLPVGEPPD